MLKTSIEWIEANEPGVLQFSIYEEESADGTVKFLLYEKFASHFPFPFAGLMRLMLRRYASQTALDEHESSEQYRELFKTMGAEEILTGAPVICRGKPFFGFVR